MRAIELTVRIFAENGGCYELKNKPIVEVDDSDAATTRVDLKYQMRTVVQNMSNYTENAMIEVCPIGILANHDNKLSMQWLRASKIVSIELFPTLDV
jgi:hypothetical protein